MDDIFAIEENENLVTLKRESDAFSFPLFDKNSFVLVKFIRLFCYQKSNENNHLPLIHLLLK